MASNTSNARRRQWFARRQVYLRAGQDSQYVELSPLLQIGVALGFGVLALWLIGASYGAVNSFLGENRQANLLAKLSSTELALEEAERARDAASQDTARIADLEAELALARTTVAEAGTSSAASDETIALETELEQTKSQVEELHQRLSESKADQAALQARFEAEVSATTDASEKTAEEAAGLHAQLEEAFGEIEALQQQRDEATARLTALSEESSAKEETTERNTALLKAATAEIERLQVTIAEAEKDEAISSQNFQESMSKLEEELGEVVAARRDLEQTVTALEAERNDAAAAKTDLERTVAAIEGERDDAIAAKTDLEGTVATLEAERDDAVTAKADLERTVDTLESELDQARLTATSAEATVADAAIAGPLTDQADTRAAMDADLHAQSIAAGLKEADLLATIDDLNRQLAAAGDSGRPDDDGEVTALRERVTLAESEVERLLLKGLTANDPSEPAVQQAPSRPVEDPSEAERLRAELLTARADIIKLEADVKAARQRLAERAESDDGQAAAKPDNSANLEQQLASSRSRVQQLNKALADAKLREVAIDLALINVVPSPSPPAPR